MENKLITDQMVSSGLICGITFDLMTGTDIEKLCNASINDASELTSSKLGLPNSSSQCSTCGATSIRDCEGHFGIMKLPRTIYNPHLVREVVNVLNQLCPGCMSVKKDVWSKKKMLKIRKSTTTTTSLYNSLLGKLKLQKKFLKMKLDKLNLPDNVRNFLSRLIIKHVKNSKFSGLKKNLCVKKKAAVVDYHEDCKYCTKSSGEWYPPIKFKILSRDAQGRSCIAVTAEFNKKIPRKFGDKSLSEVLPKDFWNFIPKSSSQSEKSELMTVNRIYLSPSQAFYLLKQLKQEVIGKFTRRRELLFLSCIPVSPNCQRLMERHHIFGDGPRLTFDKCTKTYRGVFDASKKVDAIQQSGIDPASYIAGRVQDCLNISKLHSNKTSLEDRPSCTGLKWLKEIILSKRSDNAFRMTMIGDPKLQLGEVGIPQCISNTLYVAERVNDNNLKTLRSSCYFHLLSKEQHAKRDGKIIALSGSNQLKIGDTFLRPLENGDIILINRPPSIHPHSIIALSVKVLPIDSVVSINPLCCAPLAGDFDGDCLHGYIPQSVQSRVELSELVSLDHQIFNVQDGKCLLHLTHDSLTAAHLLMEHEVYLNKFEMQQLEMLCQCKQEYPALIKAPIIQTSQWTGKQLFNMLLPSNIDTNGGMDSNISDIFYNMFSCYGNKALNYLSSIQDALCEYLTMRGFSVSLSDIYMTSDAYTRKKLIEEVGYGLEEAIDSCCYNQLLLDPEIGFILKSNDESDEIFDISVFARRRKPITQSSITQFKDVFRELQSIIHHYITSDNSILNMVHSGSKGSLIKFIQQSACIGLQLSSKPWQFRIPRKLTCTAWNQHKARDRPIDIEDDFDSYAVVESSFLDGLNPLECFVHAISCRSNMFSDNAEVPGTLTRKLMYHMRDIYVAYDGTVRNSYGQQIVQFFYGLKDDLYGKDCNYSEPAGSLAACAISEAAYGALDQPINSLESSPLMNLKKILECTPSKLSMDRTATLVLSKKLEKLNYGFEYAALAVKSYLDKVYFSDIVSSVFILYEAHDTRGTNGVKLSPWITHFHVNKETMMRKRITLQSILDVLTGAYELLNPDSPRLIMNKQKCTSGIEHKKSGEYCISVAVEDSASPDLLDIIRDSVIPFLLRTLIKGFMEFKQVDILWDSETEPDGQLVLKVAISKHCSRSKFWHTLTDVCIPIMNLIDWDRSHPDGVYGIYDAFGISAAWNYFLKNLKSATSEIRKSVHLKHLQLVADTLSITGEFHGLGAKGINKQRAHVSISSPFTQACFSNPEKCFIEAGKEASTDKLYGIVDALAWGKEAPVGTGGHFDIMYSEKVHIEKGFENIYETLLSKNSDESIKAHNQCNSSKLRDWKNAACTCSRWHDNERNTKKKKNIEFDPKFASVRVGSWANVMEMMSSLRDILHHQYSFNEPLNEADKSLVLEALTYHPKKNAKIGTGIKEIKIGHNSSHTKSRCFILIRNDDSTEDFSFRKCVVEAARKISPDFGTMVEKRLYGIH